MLFISVCTAEVMSNLETWHFPCNEFSPVHAHPSFCANAAGRTEWRTLRGYDVLTFAVRGKNASSIDDLNVHVRAESTIQLHTIFSKERKQSSKADSKISP